MVGGSRAFFFPGKDYSEAEALIMTFSLNNYPPGDPKLAQAKLWEGAFLEEMRAFQRRMAGVFQVTFMAEVGAAGSLALGHRSCGCWSAHGLPFLPRDLPTGPCDARTVFHSPSRPPGPAASDAPPDEHFFFSSSCCERSRDLRIIASSRSCPVHARESSIKHPAPPHCCASAWA